MSGLAERCPTCGGAVRVVGRTTMHYEPVDNTAEALAAYDEWKHSGRSTCPAIVAIRLAEALREATDK